MTSFSKGMRVRALVVITEGNEFPNPKSKVGESGYVYAMPEDNGTVEYVDDDGCPTIRFDRTGSATIVGDHEIIILPNDFLTF